MPDAGGAAHRRCRHQAGRSSDQQQPFELLAGRRSAAGVRLGSLATHLLVNALSPGDLLDIVDYLQVLFCDFVNGSWPWTAVDAIIFDVG